MSTLGTFKLQQAQMQILYFLVAIQSRSILHLRSSMVDGTLQTMELVANVETGSPTEKQATSYVHKSSGFMTRSEV